MTIRDKDRFILLPNILRDIIGKENEKEILIKMLEQFNQEGELTKEILEHIIEALEYVYQKMMKNVPLEEYTTVEEKNYSR